MSRSENIGLLLTVIVGLVGCTRQDIPCYARPAMFCSAFSALRAELNDAQLKEIASIDPEADMSSTYDLGGFARAQLGLWEENELTQFFKQEGVSHPDTMSVYIASGFIHYINQRPVDMHLMIVQAHKRRDDLLRRNGINPEEYNKER